MLDKWSFSRQIKIAKVVPIHKSDDDTMFNNDRPIFIIPTLSKIFDLEVIDRITYQLYQEITPININFDLSKAFDTLDHEIL